LFLWLFYSFCKGYLKPFISLVDFSAYYLFYSYKMDYLIFDQSFEDLFFPILNHLILPYFASCYFFHFALYFLTRISLESASNSHSSIMVIAIITFFIICIVFVAFAFEFLLFQVLFVKHIFFDQNNSMIIFNLIIINNRFLLRFFL